MPPAAPAVAGDARTFDLALHLASASIAGEPPRSVLDAVRRTTVEQSESDLRVRLGLPVRDVALIARFVEPLGRGPAHTDRACAALRDTPSPTIAADRQGVVEELSWSGSRAATRFPP